MFWNQPVDDDANDRDRSGDADGDVEPARGRGRDRLPTKILVLLLQAFRRDLVDPREDHCYREAEREQAGTSLPDHSGTFIMPNRTSATCRTTHAAMT